MRKWWLLTNKNIELNIQYTLLGPGSIVEGPLYDREYVSIAASEDVNLYYNVLHNNSRFKTYKTQTFIQSHLLPYPDSNLLKEMYGV